MKINIPSWLEKLIRAFVGTDRGNMIITFCESGLADAFHAFTGVLAALKTGNLERVKISFASFLDHLPEPVRTALVNYIIERFGKK